MQATALDELRCALPAGGEPRAALEWAQELGHDLTLDKASRKIQDGPAAGAWKRAQGMLKPLRRKLEKGRPPGSTASTVEKLRTLPGILPHRLADLLEAADGDDEEIVQALADSDNLPERWLARDFLGW